MQDRVNQQAKVWLLVPDSKMQILINLVQCLGVNAFGDAGMLLGPVLENEFKIRTDTNSLLQQLLNVLVEEKLERISH